MRRTRFLKSTEQDPPLGLAIRALHCLLVDALDLLVGRYNLREQLSEGSDDFVVESSVRERMQVERRAELDGRREACEGGGLELGDEIPIRLCLLHAHDCKLLLDLGA